MRFTAFIAASFLALSSGAVFASQTLFDPLTGRSVDATPSNAGGGRAAATPIPRETVAYAGPHRPGTIVVNAQERRMYLVLDGGKAIKYGVGVGRPGFEWGGSKTVTRKAEWPSWTPPAQMIKRRPDLPRFMPGGPENPMGARALYLGSSLYRIHGSNEPETIGQAVSSGCIRMLNDDVIDLYTRVRVGTQVVVQR
jgi:lipoprotein-anchoring transpeptidase ErfK/SrfK